MRKRVALTPEVRPLYYTIPDVQAMLNVGRTTVYTLIRQGDLQKVCLGSIVRISADSIDALREKLEGRSAA